MLALFFLMFLFRQLRVQRRRPAKAVAVPGISLQGSTFTVTFNGQKLFEVQDKTFTQSGKISLWTKSDSVTYFDDFSFSGKWHMRWITRGSQGRSCGLPVADKELARR